MRAVVPRTGDWRLVAPWWRWQAQGGDGRTTRPAFQKYDSSRFVDDFLANPQHSLRIDDTHDRVQELVPKPAQILGGRRRALADAELRATSMLKLFLPTHKRFYLVVCELHCEKAGFPNANREEVCEAGFVVRRRRFDLGGGTLGEARKLIGRVEKAVRALDQLEDALVHGRWFGGEGSLLEEYGEFVGTLPGLTAVAGPVASPVLSAPLTVVGEPRRQAQAELAAAREDLRRWASASGAAGVLEGWIAGLDKTGRWQNVKERPGRLVEATFPLHSLVPTPAAEQHVGANRALWFGTVPTSSADHDHRGAARFDESSVYEIRCFVRRHEPDEPRSPVGQDCCGDLTWSAPTERYQVAEHFDLTGTANHPVTIQLPNIPKLKAQAAALPIGKGASVKMVAPPGSSMKIKSQTDAKLGGAQICSLSIPLITIVAQFVFSIFLPIVVLLFQLWALLRLKFCIPPSLSLDVSAMAALELPTADQIDASVTAEAAVKTGLEASYGPDAATAALKEHTPSALAETVRTAARPKSAAKASGPIDEPEFEVEVSVA